MRCSFSHFPQNLTAVKGLKPAKEALDAANACLDTIASTLTSDVDAALEAAATPTDPVRVPFSFSLLLLLLLLLFLPHVYVSTLIFMLPILTFSCASALPLCVYV
jgi:hypothetical protein